MEDEELEQPKNKITLSSFFESIAAVEKVANNALSISNSNLNIIQEQKSLIDALSLSIEGLRSNIQEVNNYITIEKNEASDKLVETQDDKQKQMISERLQGLQGEKGEKGEKSATAPSESARLKSEQQEKKQLEEFVNEVIDKREQKKENERKDELKEKEDAEQKKKLSEKLGVKDFAKGIAQAFGGEEIEKKAGTTETTEEGGTEEAADDEWNWSEQVLLGVMQKNGITDRDAFIEFAKSYDMDGNKYLKGSELGAAAADFAAKDAPTEESPAEEPAVEEAAAEETSEESSESDDKEPAVVWRNSGDSENSQ